VVSYIQVLQLKCRNMILIFYAHPASYILLNATILVTFDEDHDIQSIFTILNIHTHLSPKLILLSMFPDPKMDYYYSIY
jgi:hypothetical protein